MLTMNTLKDRLIAALAEKTLGSQADMARECGVTNSAVSFWFNGKTKALRGKNLINAARYLGVEPSWLNEGAGLKPIRASQQVEDANQYVMVPYLTLPPVVGDRAVAMAADVPPKGPLAFRRDWLKGKGLNPDGLRVFEIKGNGMSPNIMSGDLVLVDTLALMPENDEVWVIGDQTLGVCVKRILFRERKDRILRSDNLDKSLYPDELIPAPPDGGLMVHGKVVWRGG